MEHVMKHLVCFGYGLSARTLAARLDRAEWTVTATYRSSLPDASENVRALRFGAALPADATHLLVSAPPDEEGDPVLRLYRDSIARLAHVSWTGYLSTTGVYGDRQGEWVDESSPLLPSTERGARRLAAEGDWLSLREEHPIGLHIFRLAGIYGPGRNQLLSILDGSAKRVIKPGQVFSRIHAEDIAGVLLASMARPNPGAAYNVCDDEPCPPQDVVAYAASLLGRDMPPAIPFDEATLSPMARSFYAESKRVLNHRIKQELGYKLLYPSYREGLSALLEGLKHERRA
jgi:nucleoside-diphosphate-sugar epimerase